MQIENLLLKAEIPVTPRNIEIMRQALADLERKLEAERATIS